MRAATLEVDVYRPTHLFPARPFDSLLALARTLLTPAMMLFYPVQTGRLRLTLCRQGMGGVMHYRQWATFRAQQQPYVFLLAAAGGMRQSCGRLRRRLCAARTALRTCCATTGRSR